MKRLLAWFLNASTKTQVAVLVAASLLFLVLVGSLTPTESTEPPVADEPVATATVTPSPSTTTVTPNKPDFMTFLRETYGEEYLPSWAKAITRVDGGRVYTNLYPKDSNQDAALMIVREYAVQYSPENPVVYVYAVDGSTRLAHWSVWDGEAERG